MKKPLTIAGLITIFVVFLCSISFFIGGPKRLRGVIEHEQVVRTLEVTALIVYDGKPVRLAMQAVCLNPGDYLRAVSLEAAPNVVASALPDGSVIAFKGMTHLCRQAEMAITQELNGAAGPRILRKETPTPMLGAVWFSDPRRPEIIEEYLSPQPNASRYQPIAFSMREIPTTPGQKPSSALRKTLPIWGEFESRSLRLCSAMVARLPSSALSTVVQQELAIGRFRPQELRPNQLRAGASPFIFADVSFSDASAAETDPELRQLLQEQQAQRSRLLVAIQENGTWVARPLQAFRYYAEPHALPDTIRVGATTLQFRDRWIVPLPGTSDAVAMQGDCLPRH